MSERLIHPVLPAATDDLHSGVWLLLHGADQVPPHLIMVIAGEYFSLSVLGLRTREHVSGLIRTIQSKGSKVLCIKVKLTGVPEQLQKEADEIFRSFQRPSAGKITCLYPIREFFSRHISSTLSNAGFVFELYSMLQEKERIGKSIHYNMQDLLNGNQSFQLKEYTQSEIDSCITKLEGNEGHA